ncbi:hypothetical protein FN846DRAFT_920801 [Sphaerosporella brunnea]|uniref:Uncharacterized protein n=1 Tax=Sphaerosporella brunnea TaxID=1250544 RepID=A0A5J5EQ76_9PEZI|nr:hypothetical protein FN846DRAFT_920801 [Sphaerosporella brunnea]
MTLIDPTGGLVEISQLRDSPSCLAEEFSSSSDDEEEEAEEGDEEEEEEADPQAAFEEELSSPLVATPPPPIPKPRRRRRRRCQRLRYRKRSFLTTLKTSLTELNKAQLNHRLRLVFRIVSLIASGTTLGALGSVLYTYEMTKHAHSHHDGSLLWPQNVSFVTTRVQLAAAVVAFAGDLGFFIASYKPRVRRLDAALLKSFALVATGVCISVLASAIGAYEVAMKPTLVWTCEAKDLHWDEVVDFPFLCGELVASRWMMVVALVFQALILATILFDMFYRGDRPKKPKATVKEGFKAITGWQKVLDRVGL